MTIMKIGVLGGTFNPIHNGHLAAAEEVRRRLDLDKVLFVPSCLPPHKHEEGAPSALQRLEMVRLAVSGNAYFEVSDIEIKRGGKSYTIDTIEELGRAWPNAELYFITGLDSFLDIQTWRRWQELLARCRFVVLARPGYRFAELMKLDFLKSAADELSRVDRGALPHARIRSGAFSLYLENIPLHDVSSTDIRALVKQGGNIKYFLPEAVEIYIMKNNIYA